MQDDGFTVLRQLTVGTAMGRLRGFLGRRFKSSCICRGQAKIFTAVVYKGHGLQYSRRYGTTLHYRDDAPNATAAGALQCSNHFFRQAWNSGSLRAKGGVFFPSSGGLDCLVAPRHPCFLCGESTAICTIIHATTVKARATTAQRPQNLSDSPLQGWSRR